MFEVISLVTLRSDQLRELLQALLGLRPPDLMPPPLICSSEIELQSERDLMRLCSVCGQKKDRIHFQGKVNYSRCSQCVSFLSQGKKPGQGQVPVASISLQLNRKQKDQEIIFSSKKCAGCLLLKDANQYVLSQYRKERGKCLFCCEQLASLVRVQKNWDKKMFIPEIRVGDCSLYSGRQFQMVDQELLLCLHGLDLFDVWPMIVRYLFMEMNKGSNPWTVSGALNLLPKYAEQAQGFTVGFSPIVLWAQEGKKKNKEILSVSVPSFPVIITMDRMFQGSRVSVTDLLPASCSNFFSVASEVTVQRCHSKTWCHWRLSAPISDVRNQLLWITVTHPMLGAVSRPFVVRRKSRSKGLPDFRVVSYFESDLCAMQVGPLHGWLYPFGLVSKGLLEKGLYV